MSGRMYLSECGQYVCRTLEGIANFEVWTVDGSVHWVDDDRIKTWDDAKQERHPLPYSVGGYSATMAGQKPGSFTLTLLHCDTSMIVKPWTGNTILEKRNIVFRRKIPSNHVAAWVRRLAAGARDGADRTTSSSTISPENQTGNIETTPRRMK